MAVLLLRPAPTMNFSCQQFAAAGLDAIGMATVDIAFSREEISRLATHLSAENNETVIVTSQYAAQAIKQLGDNCLSSRSVVAVGKKTAQGLPTAKSLDIPEQQNSEGIISILATLDPPSTSLILVKGDGGRSAITDWCESESRQVDVFNVYRRVQLNPPVSTRQWKAEEIQCIIATSGEQLELTYNEYEADWLNQIPWIVASNRIAGLAQQYGVRKVLTSADATDQSLINSAKRILE